MVCRKLRIWLVVFLLTGSNVWAQSFSDSQLSNIATESENTPNLPILSDDDIEKELTAEENAKRIKWLENETFMPRGGLNVLDKETEDGSVRGKSLVVEINGEGESRRPEKIFLYSENFKISTIAKNTTSCDIRFVIMSNLDRKLNQLDVKLVWPNMMTTLSFSNIMPNTPTYMDYTLIGEGCYTMDRMPNIVVNRCRVRGISAVECANKIVWLKMNN